MSVVRRTAQKTSAAKGKAAPSAAAKKAAGSAARKTAGVVAKKSAVKKRTKKPVPAKKTAAKKKSSAPAVKKKPVASPPKKAKPVAAAPAPKPPPPPPPPRQPLVTLTIATRRSDLAVKQAELVIERFAARLPTYAFKLLKLVTTGDRQEEWSLELAGGQGLFTGEIEATLRDHRADIAVHSAKDLPGQITDGLDIAGYLPREDPRDILIIREGLSRPATVATSSPRRRQQLQRQFVKAGFMEIRGNVETRLQKIADGLADATVLAAAGLNRLGITEWPGLRFQMLPLAVCVPAPGQGAIAVQARPETAAAMRPHLDEATRRAVELERAFLRQMGGGCHTAFAAHYDGAAVHIFHDSCGYQRFNLPANEAYDTVRVAKRILSQLTLNA